MFALRHRLTRFCSLIAATLPGLLGAQAQAVELLVNQQTGAVTVLAAPNLAASQTAEKSLRSEEQLAQTAKWLGENSDINRLPDDALLAITLQSNGKVSVSNATRRRTCAHYGSPHAESGRPGGR